MRLSFPSSRLLCESIRSKRDTYCDGLYFSARWFALAEVAAMMADDNNPLIHFIILPDKEQAEYCSSDLYSIVPEETVYFFPDSGRNVERSNYKSTLGVQRTSAVSKLLQCRKDNVESLFFVSYPSALAEKVPIEKEIERVTLHLEVGDEISFDDIKEKLFNMGFTRVDFVGQPGQFAIRGSLVDVFSFTNNDPYRVSFFGDEVEKIHTFDCNTQLSKESRNTIDILSDIISSPDEGIEEQDVFSLLPSSTVFWLEGSDLYRDAEFYPLLEGRKKVFITIPLEKKVKSKVKFSISPQPAFRKNFNLLINDVRSHIDYGYEVYLCADKKQQLERIKAVFSKENELYRPKFVSDVALHNGFIDNDSKVCCYTDHEIFERFHRVSLRMTVEKSEVLTLSELTSMNVGDYVVHIDYGVGVFGGLVKMREPDGRVHEVVKLMYKDGDVVFISVHSINKISRFRSKDDVPPRVDKLGSKSWQVLKQSTKARVKDIAKELIELYARRKSSDGFAFSPDTYLQEELESSFMYEDTPDQLSATLAVKGDMEDRAPMDRLVCGDVGFGKTEVAIRAAFKAVADNKQVAVLVPTTILALQHYKTFTSRLENFPCNVEYVSRLRTAKDTSRIRENIKNGRIDIIIGTHKLLGKDFEFKDLGLLVIDEEQKFGVAAKEKLRKLKESIDTLTLTATPIPRTLQFSLLGARDLSVINTPPPNRIPVQTEIILFDKNEIKSIIEYELNRGGQIFFLHNKVEELDSIYDILHRMVPDMRICVAHGQMEARILESKMLAFMDGDYDMLLCTTIIENGLDIPNANTIIINQAQNFGLSDLHQLRGRVGRSNRKAFCYLIVPPLASIGSDARKRLKAIEEFSDLGSGFSIAMEDLDIRGAGNLLGAEQSGFITDMGYDTYQKILNEAMEELGMETGIVKKKDRKTFSYDCLVETDFDAFIPDSYIDINFEKLRIYKELDNMCKEEEIRSLASKIEDRFGPMPPELSNLLDILRIRNLGCEIGFERIILKNGNMIAFFVSNVSSPFYSDAVFNVEMHNIGKLKGDVQISNKDNRSRVIVRGSVTSTRAALDILRLIDYRNA